VRETAVRNRHLQSLAVRVLGAVYVWSGRLYRRERLRQELWRIGRELAAERRKRQLEGEGGPPLRLEFQMRQGRHSGPG
jgi:hypothetical protein